ncbi:hypothetical protein ACHHYP_02039 [Achlya hypogyna]|uniref:PD-(D/E)XK endonuclease-like domain-containing protein n=1 Tax=Achlya hypogyna TaxID=1202772 RepID=A0A1V9ZSL0_ACHHY|nr:hypothetical protein ACHHYP_02039 [Achlya hypogyna]
MLGRRGLDCATRMLRAPVRPLYGLGSSSTFSTKYKSNYEKQIVIYASEVAVICGVHPYRCISDVFFSTWKRTDKAHVQQLEAQLAPSIPATIEERVEKLIQDEPLVQELLDTPSQTTEDVKRVKTQVKEQIEALRNLTADEKAEITQALNSTLHTQFGIAQETHALTQYETTTQTSVEQRNAKFWSKRLGRVATADGGYRNVLVGGRIDGLTGEKVIEVKNRMTRFMTPLPKYDVYQLQTYLFLLDSTEGEIVEHLKKTADSSKTTKVAWDPALWDENVIPYVARFSNALAKFMDGPQEAQAAFLTLPADGRKEIIRSLWIESPGVLNP